MDVQTALTMRCTACGALAQASCQCGAPYEALSQAENIQKRREQVAEHAAAGMVQAEIAAKLNVSQQTISGDLGNLPNVGKSRPHAKTGRNPKGAGRPRGGGGGVGSKPRPTKAPGVKQAQRSINLHPDVWQLVKERAAAASLPAADLIGQLLTAQIDPQVDVRALSKTAQDKLAAAIRQYRRKLDGEYEQRRIAEVRAHIERITPDLQAQKSKAIETERFYREWLEKQKKKMSIEDFRLISSCLHPDSRASVSEEKLTRAFQLFEPLQFALTGIPKKHR